MKSTGTASLALIPVLILALSPAAPAEELMALAAGERNLYRIDSENLPAPTLVGSISVGTDLCGLVAASSDRLYTFDRDGNTLITLSANDASVLSVMALDRDILSHPRGFDISPSGVLYGVFADMELYTIDPATGHTSFMAPITGAGMIEAIAFSPDGTLYAAGSTATDTHAETLYLLDPQTGVLSLIGLMGPIDVDCLTFGYDGNLYGADSLAGWSADLYRIDPHAGTATVVGDSGVIELNGIAAIPEPTGLLLLALGGLALVRRRR